MKDRIEIEISMLEEEKQLQQNRITDFSLHGRQPSDQDFNEMKIILEQRTITVSKINLLKRALEWK